jgi:hypothetical protein
VGEIVHLMSIMRMAIAPSDGSPCTGNANSGEARIIHINQESKQLREVLRRPKQQTAAAHTAGSRAGSLPPARVGREMCGLDDNEFGA